MKCIVLLSGGLDSAVSLAWAKRNKYPILCLTFLYGQKAAHKEKEAAVRLAGHYQVDITVVEIPFLKEITKTALVNEDLEVPGALDLEDEEEGKERAKKVWVPNRNGIFLNVAAAYVESLEASIIIAGFNREEAVSFPDNSPEFIQAVNNSLEYSTLSKVKVISPTQNLNKEEIVTMGHKLDLPFGYIWSCYTGEDKMCGECESCQRLDRALGKN